MSNFPLFPPANVVNVVFWRESSLKNGNPILSIDEVELLNFLQENGFGRFRLKGKSVLARKVNNQIHRVSIGKIFNFAYDHVCNFLSDEISESFIKDDLKTLLVDSKWLFSRGYLNCLAWIDADQEGVRHD